MDLLKAFDLPAGAIVAAVGGGGKTSLVYGLGEQAAASGLSAIVTTTTRFTRRAGGSMPAVIEAPEGEALAAASQSLRAGEWFVLSAGKGPLARMLGFTPETIDALAGLEAGLIAVEADGSAHRPFKAPAPHEPVIPSRATDVIVCVGLEILGKPIDEEHVHRPEIVARLARASIGDTVTIEHLLGVLSHDDGGRKGVPPGARLHALLNAPGDDEQRELGKKLAGRLIFGGYQRAIVGTLHRSEIDMIAC